MRACILALSAAALAASAQGAEAPASTDDDALIQLEKQSWVAWQGHDAKFFEGFLSDDHVELGFGGPTGKKTVVAGVGAGCTVANYAVDQFTVTHLTADSAVVVYHAAQDTMCGTTKVPSPVWVASTYAKRDGKWMNVVYQQTVTNK